MYCKECHYYWANYYLFLFSKKTITYFFFLLINKQIDRVFLKEINRQIDSKGGGGEIRIKYKHSAPQNDVIIARLY